MPKRTTRALPSQNGRELPSAPSLDLRELENGVKDWLLDGELRHLSKNTLANRKIYTDKLLWFLRREKLSECGTRELRAFLAYLSKEPEGDAGRWGNQRLKSAVRPSTTATYFRHLRTLFTFLVSESILGASPMENLRPPVSRADQIKPFTPDQVKALLKAAMDTELPKRNAALLLFLLDTGARASEVCSLKVKDVDVWGRSCIVRGKGDKFRTLYFGKETTKALRAYLRGDEREPDDPFFLADPFSRQGAPLTRCGLLKLIHRLGKAAEIETVRCSPHTMRHTFAVSFLRNGGNVFALKELLGHTTLAMVNKYVALAQADMENQHRQFSPADHLNPSS